MDVSLQQGQAESADLTSQLSLLDHCLDVIEGMGECILREGMTDFVSVIADLQEIVLLPFFQKQFKKSVMCYWALFYAKQIRPKVQTMKSPRSMNELIY